MQIYIIYGVSIVFVCSGNIIRSAFCELLLKHKVNTADVSSLGLFYKNSIIHPKTREALLERGVPHVLIDNFKPTFADDIVLDPDNLYFCMTMKHKSDLLCRGIPESNIRLVSSVLNQHVDVEDPYFIGNYDQVFSYLKKCIEKIVEEMLDQ